MGLYLLIPVSVVIVFVIGVIFWWSVRSGQFDDLEGPAYRLLLDDKDPVPGDGDGQASRKDPGGAVGRDVDLAGADDAAGDAASPDGRTDRS